VDEGGCWPRWINTSGCERERGTRRLNRAALAESLSRASASSFPEQKRKPDKRSATDACRVMASVLGLRCLAQCHRDYLGKFNLFISLYLLSQHSHTRYFPHMQCESVCVAFRSETAEIRWKYTSLSPLLTLLLLPNPAQST
jgi:hypothetical protein